MGPNLSPRVVIVKNVIQLSVAMWVIGGLNDKNGWSVQKIIFYA